MRRLLRRMEASVLSGTFPGSAPRHLADLVNVKLWDVGNLETKDETVVVPISGPIVRAAAKF